jgi:hypothetical protein
MATNIVNGLGRPLPTIEMFNTKGERRLVNAFEREKYVEKGWTDNHPGDPRTAPSTTTDDLTSFTVPQLKEFADSNGLDVTGNKSKIIEQLEAEGYTFADVTEFFEE